MARRVARETSYRGLHSRIGRSRRTMSASTPERGTPSNEDPGCWQSKAALERIRQALDGKKAVTSALAGYLALREIASDEEGHTFSTTHAHIASRCGLSVRTVAARLKDLASIALVAIVTPQRLAPSTYTLLSFGNDCRTIRNGCRTFGNGPKQVTLPRSEEKEEKEEKARRPRLTTA